MNGRMSDIDAPIVGMVVTISPSLSLYRMVVFPAASRPTFIKWDQKKFSKERKVYVTIRMPKR